ncbi:MAG TPA: PQQ-binding-like beta-propeller repeat protein, partial [Candidatus Dormibacteraeota bacterium]|nr:PQQ-binding-like beta-propeller repeat protein [Candidatus Dormibacteraeota bacterium]
MSRRSLLKRLICAISATTLAVLGSAAQIPGSERVSASNGIDWPMYGHDLSRTNASSEAILSTANAPLLQKKWAFLTGGVIAAAPTIVQGVAYIGSWDGFEYALDANTGTFIWKTYIGQTSAPLCLPPAPGVTSTAAVQNGVVYVGGGDSYWYALNAANGAILWRVFTGDNSAASGHYNWSSPTIYGHYAFVGVASECDIPLVQGQFLQIDLNTQQVVNSIPIVPSGQVGGGVWTSPAVDPSTNTVYIDTGTLHSASPSQTMSEAVLAIDANSLVVKDVWQLPRSQAGIDSDWGTSPILFQDAHGRSLLAAINKNGVLYAFDRTNLHAGPVWQRQIMIGGDCPTCGDGSVSSGAFANGVLYFAGGNALINGVVTPGFVSAFDPTTGNTLWTHQTDRPVIPALSVDNGAVLAIEGTNLEVLDASTGIDLYDYATAGPGYSQPVVWNGNVYFGGSDGTFYDLTLGSPATIPSDPNCPAPFTCEDIGNPPAGSEQTNGSVLTLSASGT